MTLEQREAAAERLRLAREKKGNNIRTSLSFNVFVKGDLGNLVDGTPLTIGDSTQLTGLDI